MHFELVDFNTALVSQPGSNTKNLNPRPNEHLKETSISPPASHPFPGQFRVHLQESHHARAQLSPLKAASVLASPRDCCIERVCFLLQDTDRSVQNDMPDCLLPKLPGKQEPPGQHTTSDTDN